MSKNQKFKLGDRVLFTPGNAYGEPFVGIVIDILPSGDLEVTPTPCKSVSVSSKKCRVLKK